MEQQPQEPQQHNPQQPYAPQQPSAAPQPVAVLETTRPRRRRTAVALFASGVLSLGLIGGGMGLGAALAHNGTDLTVAPSTDTGTDTQQGTTQDQLPSYGSFGQQTAPGQQGQQDQQSQGSTSGSSSLDVTEATAEQSQGVVLINTVLGYASAEAAGSGIVMTSDGLILTNNHVIEGSTEITVTVPETGATYTATVVGTDATADIAVLQLQDASGLTTATVDDDGDPAVGDTVTAVGNAEGGGTLMAASGAVTALEQSITTQSEGVSAGESLTNLIQVDADVVSGDSGGALLDDEGEVVGITTAASSGSSDITGYAIPIEDALTVAKQIVSGEASDTVTIGLPAFLGVQLSTSSTGLPGATGTGAVLGGVIEDTPAAEAGLVAGDTITAVDGTTVTSGDELSAALAEYAPGDQVTLTWTTAAGATQTATVTLIEGPAA
ncbi:S1C family serine protease [Cellulomonas sp. RIT-PI-Y]|uniref:S1C family serine protease n=1 Tax=Cellulomonas sp. RIT-PI-Y TaxID=3035297 RepID=UPI0021D9B13A|nr:S1C family serine protease [Cellulomonas sp. RIT-PI-Y]